MKKLGFQAQKNARIKRFNYVSIKGDLHYCKSHNFVYDVEVEKQKLYSGLPNYFTDDRYISGNQNFFKETYLHHSRYRYKKNKYNISLKAAFRLVEKTRNIPIGTIVNFSMDYYIANIDLGYRYIVKKDNSFDPDYQVFPFLLTLIILSTIIK